VGCRSRSDGWARVVRCPRTGSSADAEPIDHPAVRLDEAVVGHRQDRCSKASAGPHRPARAVRRWPECQPPQRGTTSDSIMTASGDRSRLPPGTKCSRCRACSAARERLLDAASLSSVMPHRRGSGRTRRGSRDPQREGPPAVWPARRRRRLNINVARLLTESKANPQVNHAR